MPNAFNVLEIKLNSNSFLYEISAFSGFHWILEKFVKTRCTALCDVTTQRRILDPPLIYGSVPPSESVCESEKIKEQAKEIKENVQTSKEIFAFRSVFARCEWALTSLSVSIPHRAVRDRGAGAGGRDVGGVAAVRSGPVERPLPARDPHGSTRHDRRPQPRDENQRRRGRDPQRTQPQVRTESQVRTKPQVRTQPQVRTETQVRIKSQVRTQPQVGTKP